jgi:protein-disulfide isomerase
LSSELVSEALGSSLVLGIILGLVVGKTLGIPIGAWLATRPWLGGQALAVGWPSLIAAASVAGIGFTMSLLIAELSYVQPLLDEAKLGILTASVIAAVLSTFLFHAIGWLPREWIRKADARTSELITDLTAPVDPARDHIRGPLDAPVTLLEYGDFECPHCGEAAPIVHDVLDRMGDRVRFVFRHLPLTDIHPRSEAAAESSEAAAAQGAFWEMHDRLFANQDDLDLHDLPRHAEALGLDADAVRAALRERAYEPRVAEDIASADSAGIAGTPTFFIDGVMLTGHHDRRALESALHRALRQAELRETAG